MHSRSLDTSVRAAAALIAWSAQTRQCVDWTMTSRSALTGTTVLISTSSRCSMDEDSQTMWHQAEMEERQRREDEALAAHAKLLKEFRAANDRFDEDMKQYQVRRLLAWL